MKIGELAAATDTAIETIRFYEREGLLQAAARSGGNFRLYEAPHLERLQFIRYCRSLDMSLDEVRVLLRFRDKPEEACADVNALLDEHMGHVSKRIQELKELERQLKDLRRRCGSDRSAKECGVLSGLSQAARDTSGVVGKRGHLKSVHGR